MRALRQRRKADRPLEIIQAAFEEFSLNGFAATRLDDVATRAGITKGTIYVYFKAKEDLFVAMAKEMIRPAFEHLDSAAKDPKGPAFEILKGQLAFAADYLVTNRQGREAFRMLIAEGGRFPDIVDRYHTEVAQPLCDAFAAVVAYGIARGEFRAVDTMTCAKVIIAPIIMANNWLIMFGERQPLDIHAFFATALDVIAYGLFTERT